ncbi:MAG: hypothetical protein NTX42_09885 [Methanothrix sp.]|nr:hypothetical protein [Methanothrix sp.]
MNYIRLLVALVAACILVMPALSMPNNEMGQGQKQCNCPNSLKDCTQMGQGQDGKENPCGCQKSMMGEDGKQMGQGQDGKENPCGCQKSMMGEDGKAMGHKSIKSMMGDKGREDKVEVKIVIINVNT